MTLRQPREIVVRRRSVPLSERGVLGGHLSTRSTERLPSDERVCVTQHGVQEEGIVDEEQREREEERKGVTLDLYTVEGRWNFRERREEKIGY